MLATFNTSISRELLYLLRQPGRVLFDHLPKCAGTTIVEHVARHYPARYIFKTDARHPHESVEAFKRLSEQRRYEFRVIVGHEAHALIDHVHPNTYKFTIFRDPVDRIVSHYYYVLQEPSHYLHQEIKGSKITLDKYCSSGLSGELRNWYTTHFTGLSIEDAEAEPEAAVEMAIRSILDNYQLVGFQSDLDHVINEINKGVRLKKHFLNTKDNRTQGRKGLADIPESTRDKITEINFLDVMLYSRLEKVLVST